MPTFEKSLELPITAGQAFTLHEQPGILESLSPPWERMEVVQPPTSLRPGTQVVLRLEYALPLSALSWPVDALVVRRKLVRMFEFRHQQTTKLALAQASKGP